MENKLPDIYDSLFNTTPFKPKSEKVTLGLIFGNETADFYERYLHDLHLLTIELIPLQQRKQKVDVKTYYNHASKLLLAFMVEGNSNKRLIENFFIALSIVINSDDVNELMEATIGMMYELFDK